MKLRSLKYLLMFIPPLVILFSILSLNYWSFFALFFIFGIIPFIELFTNGSKENLSEIEEEIISKDRFYDFWLYLLVPTQYILLFVFLNQISIENTPLIIKFGITSAFALSCGILGINAAHELGHRTTWYEQFMSKLLLLSTLYMHFFIEHNRGHHTNVSTDEDPASSRYGENIYFFYVRSIICSYQSAWKLEMKKLEIQKKSFWSMANEMLIFQIIQLVLVVLIAIFFGFKTLLFFLIAAFLGILLLETVNYIEHYGLRRKVNGTRYERTKPIHSWNSNHPIGRVLLLELSRHSDHHYIASRKYQLLRHFDESPQMPTGYPGMMLLALIPPLWFKVMHQSIENYKKTQKGEDLA
jgi:alkane 1-monooxygenase